MITNSPPVPERIPFTAEAYQKLKVELDRLSVVREEVIIRLQTAREQGDLSENSAYKYAKMELGNISKEQRRLKYLITFGKVQAIQSNSQTVTFGSTVTIKNDKKELTFMLVSEHESDPSQNKLSLNSPIGKAVLGKKLGDEVIAQLPIGEVTWKIVKLS